MPIWYLTKNQSLDTFIQATGVSVFDTPDTIYRSVLTRERTFCLLFCLGGHYLPGGLLEMGGVGNPISWNSIFMMAMQLQYPGLGAVQSLFALNIGLL